MDTQLILILGFVAFTLALLVDQRIGWIALMVYTLLRLIGKA